MNIMQMYAWFNLISDKTGSPYFSNSEISLYINRATIDFVREMVDSSMMKTDRVGVKEGFEKNNISSEIISFLTTETVYSTTSDGIIKKADLEAVLSTIFNFPCTYMQVLGIVRKYYSDYYPCRKVRLTDFNKQKMNRFLRPTPRSPVFKETEDAIIIEPGGVANVKITLMRYPRQVSIDDNVSSDLPDICHNQIMDKALRYAGLSYRDEFLYEAEKEK